MANEEFTPEELAELGEEAPTSAPKKRGRGGAIALTPEPVTLDSVMGEIGAALASPAKLLKAFSDGLADAEKKLRASKTKFNKAVNTAVSGAQTKDSVLIINTKSLNVDEALQVVVSLRAKLAEAGLSGLANTLSTKKTSLDKSIRTIKATLHMLQSAQPEPETIAS